jgi:murein DD-endopeptidase MepM/ murein hydrolase activator NlpD
MKRSLAALGAALVAAFAVTVAPQAASAAAPSWPVLNTGQSGANVATAQFLLRQAGQTLVADGVYGAGTKAAVTSFQTAKGLSADGVVGAATWGALAVTLEPGASNSAVQALQTSLNKYGYNLAVDGSFGTGTVNAVNDFKAKNFLGGGSTVGATTWQFLVGGGAGGAYRLPVDRSILPGSEYDDPHHDYPAIDLPVGTGTTAYAIAAGSVIYVGGGCGLGIGVNGDDGGYYQYCHLSQRNVASGARVNAGTVIGLTGATGNVTGPHLHIEIRVNGGNRCPQPMLTAIYNGSAVPSPASLPSTGCFYSSRSMVSALADDVT